MAWKRSRVRIPSGPPNKTRLIKHFRTVLHEYANPTKFMKRLDAGLEIHKLRSEITAILHKHRVLVLPKGECNKHVPWLTSEADIFTDRNQSEQVRVRFFETV